MFIQRSAFTYTLTQQWPCFSGQALASKSHKSNTSEEIQAIKAMYSEDENVQYCVSISRKGSVQI